jgi:hypothetical protein
MAAVLTDIVGGSRDSGPPARLNDPTHRAVTGLVLHHIAEVESANGRTPRWLTSS